MHSITANNFQQWRAAARGLINAGVSPDKVQWQSAQQAGLFSTTSEILADQTISQSRSLLVPAAFLSQAKQAACFIESGNADHAHRKWSVLYSLLWRITQIDKHSLMLKSDSDVQALQRMCKSVSRDRHKMKAFVRFKCVNQQKLQEGKSEASHIEPYYTAWFEPAHSILELVAPFFVKRFTSMNWSILTPQGCAHWNQSELSISEGISRPEIAEDQYDEFWRAYYCNIFNPARLKEQAMRSEMPKKYWKYLPESICIKDLVNNSGARVERMLSSTNTRSDRMRAASGSIVEFQDHLRQSNRK